MGSLTDSLSTLATPELLESVARMIGVDMPTAREAGRLGVPLLIIALAKQTEQPGGRDTVSALLDQVGPGVAARPHGRYRQPDHRQIWRRVERGAGTDDRAASQ